MLESDISSDAVSAVMDALRKNLIGQRLRKGCRTIQSARSEFEKSPAGNIGSRILGF